MDYRFYRQYYLRFLTANIVLGVFYCLSFGALHYFIRDRNKPTYFAQTTSGFLFDLNYTQSKQDIPSPRKVVFS